MNPETELPFRETSHLFNSLCTIHTVLKLCEIKDWRYLLEDPCPHLGGDPTTCSLFPTCKDSSQHHHFAILTSFLLWPQNALCRYACHVWYMCLMACGPRSRLGELSQSAPAWRHRFSRGKDLWGSRNSKEEASNSHLGHQELKGAICKEPG